MAVSMEALPSSLGSKMAATTLPELETHVNPVDFGLDLKLAMQSQRFGFKLQQGLKRTLDIVLSLGGIIALSPMFLVIAAAILITDPGPIFYKSLRVGRNQKFFYMYKFRTMINGADKLRDKLRAENQQEGELFKIQNDTRITPLGAFLRKYSLDEFPQLLNVLKGDMSLVGPRPFSPDNCTLFQAPYTMRFKVMPGMTGKWQVSGRSNLSFQQACDLDLSYVLQWNILEDLQILFKTVPTVLLKKGAY